VRGAIEEGRPTAVGPSVGSATHRWEGKHSLNAHREGREGEDAGSNSRWRGYRGGSTNRGRTVGRERNASLGRRLLVIDAIFDRGHHRGTFPTAGCPRRATPLLPESLFGVLGGLTSAPRRGLVVTRRCREITRFCATEGGARSLRPARQAGHQLGPLADEWWASSSSAGRGTRAPYNECITTNLVSSKQWCPCQNGSAPH